VKPTLLIVTTTNWVPTARLAMALANAGFKVEMLCPAGHPVRETVAVSRLHVYDGLMPLRSLRHAITTAKPDLVLPGDDLATFHLHDLYRQRESSGPDAIIESLIERSLGSPESFSIVQSRAAFMELAQQEGVRIPKTEIVRSEASVKDALAKVGLPAVIKADGTSGGDGVRVVRTVAEGQSAFRKLQASPLIARALKRAVFDHDRTLIWPALRRIRPTVNAQAFVAGHEATSTVACWKGTVLASLHFEVLRKGNAAGHATVVRLIENAEISSAVEKVVRRLGLSGLCGFDFMVETNSGHAYLIEINPRSTQVGHLTLGAGRDLPAALFGAVTENPARAAATATENDTVALFPHEWARDPQSEFLRTAYHDVPWDAPELVHACIRRSRKQSVWYSRAEADHETAIVSLVKPAKESSGVVRLDCGTD
jgi:hypothetical protein